MLICRDLRSFASIALSGSSRSRTLGSMTMLLASATLCCCPPERLAGCCFSFPFSSTILIAPATFSLIAAGSIFLSFSPNAIFSSAVILGNRLYCWKTIPIFRSFGSLSVMSSPSRKIRPPFTSSSPARHRRSVLFPQPEGPKSVTNCPFSILRSIPFKTWFEP